VSLGIDIYSVALDPYSLATISPPFRNTTMGVHYDHMDVYLYIDALKSRVITDSVITTDVVAVVYETPEGYRVVAWLVRDKI